MSYEEKGIWVYLVTVAGAYAVYLAIILARLRDAPAIAGSVVKLVAYRRGL